VAVPVFVGLIPVTRNVMFVSMMLIVNVAMTMLHWLMHMFVLMVLGEVQPYPAAHQGGCNPERNRGRLAQQN